MAIDKVNELNPDFVITGRRILFMILCAVITNKANHFFTVCTKDMSKGV